MSNFDYLGYGQRKRAATAKLGTDLASGAQANFLAQQRGTRKKFDIQQQYEKDAPRAVNRFTQRGLAGPNVQSGVFAKGMTEMATKNFDDIAGAQREMDDAQSQWTLEEGRLRSQYDTDMADLEAEKQQQISSAAATLQMFKPFLGG